MTSQNHAAMAQRLNKARSQAEAALTAATDALQTAQLQAVGAGIPVPGKLNDDVATARRQLSECEGALIAFAKQGDTEAVAAWRAARDEREAAVEAAAADFVAAVEAAQRELTEMLATGAGAAMISAIDALRAPTRGASVCVLTPAGWLTSEHLRQLMPAHSAHEIAQLLMDRMLQHALLGKVRDSALEFAGAFASDIRRTITAQPDNWPAVN